MLIKRSHHHIIVAIYVDNILLTSTNSSTIDELKAYLHQSFSIKDELKAYLHQSFSTKDVGSGVFTKRHLTQFQQKFTKELLCELGFDLSKKTTTHLPLHLKLQVGDLLPDLEVYRPLVGNW